MKTLFFIILSLISCAALAGPPIFLESQKDAQKISKELNMKILTVVSADWCLYCKKLDDTLYNHLEIIEDIIVLKIDFDTDKDFVRKHNIKKIPTIIIDDKQYIGKYSLKDIKDILKK